MRLLQLLHLPLLGRLAAQERASQHTELSKQLQSAPAGQQAQQQGQRPPSSTRAAGGSCSASCCRGRQLPAAQHAAS